MRRGTDHPLFKGEAASYTTVHKWMRRNFPKTGRCEYCGRTDRVTQYASASHSRYTLNRADWFELCVPCHRAVDGLTPAHCRRGHTYTPETTYIVPATGKRSCRICARIRRRKRTVAERRLTSQT